MVVGPPPIQCIFAALAHTKVFFRWQHYHMNGIMMIARNSTTLEMCPIHFGLLEGQRHPKNVQLSKDKPFLLGSWGPSWRYHVMLRFPSCRRNFVTSKRATSTASCTSKFQADAAAASVFILKASKMDAKAPQRGICWRENARGQN